MSGPRGLHYVDHFTTTTLTTAAAILKIFIVVAVAGFLVRRKILTDAMVTALSRATILLFLPCLIIDKIVGQLSPADDPLWWTLPLAAVAMVVVGLAAAALLFLRELPEKRNMLPLASMQNAGYLILPVGLALYPGEFDQFALYTSLFIMGFNPLLWSIGKLLATDEVDRQPGLRGLLNPPLAACLLAIALVLSGLSRFIPRPVLDAVELVGQGAVPVATVVLGAMLGGMTLHLRSHLWDLTRVLLVKYGFLPALTIAALWVSGLGEANPLLARFLVLEAAAAPAANLILQVRAYGGDEQKVGSIMFVSYLVCIVSLPVWLAVWESISM
jgi:predicted permease